MKPIMIILFILFGTFCFRLSATNPIPSYNVNVYYVANFQEKPNYTKSKRSFKEKRDLVIRTSGFGGPTCICTVWVYSLDGKDVIGPDTMSCNEQRSFEIDERDWGVVVESDDHVTVDVWIDAGGEGGGGDPLGDAKMPEGFLQSLLAVVNPSSATLRFQ
jgi:hypothetical protein